MLVFCVINYLLSFSRDVIAHSKLKTTTAPALLSGLDLLFITLIPTFLSFFVTFAWVSPLQVTWCGNILFSSFQIKISYLIFFFFAGVNMVFATSSYSSAKNTFDFPLVTINFFYWIIFLFFSNNLFVFIFFLEILSTLIFLLVVTSTFSSNVFYNNLNLTLHSYFNGSTPLFFVQILIFFFWTSLLTSLNLFFFLILFYLRFLSFDWFLFEHLFLALTLNYRVTDFFFLFLIWFNLLFCIFLKCGLVPFYFWKPIFFKGLSYYALFFYIIFFYYFMFLFINYFLLIYAKELFFFFLKITLLLLLFGFFFFFLMLCEAFYLKAFLALSSVLNTLFVLLTLTSTNGVDFFFSL